MLDRTDRWAENIERTPSVGVGFATFSRCSRGARRWGPACSSSCEWQQFDSSELLSFLSCQSAWTINLTSKARDLVWGELDHIRAPLTNSLQHHLTRCRNSSSRFFRSTANRPEVYATHTHLSHISVGAHGPHRGTSWMDLGARRCDRQGGWGCFARQSTSCCSTPHLFKLRRE